MKIYVPEYTPQKYPCVRISSSTLRAYHQTPQSNRVIEYTEFYLANHYMSVDGTQQFSNTVNVICEPQINLTNEYWYRTDIADLLLAFAILVVATIYFPFKLFERIFRRR